MKDKMAQVELGKKISLILEDRIGHYFHPKNQGAGVVLNLKIAVTNGNSKFVKMAKDFLKEEFSINLEKIKGHGAGSNEYTFIIKTAELTDASIVKIELMYQNLLLRKSGHKVVEPKNQLSESGKTEPCEKEEVDEQAALISVVAHKREMSDTAKYRLALSRYLRPIMEMEGVIPNQFPFDQDMNDGGMITVRCQDYQFAIMIERSIAYYSEDLVARDGTVVMVDGSKFYGLEHKPFAFPPKEGQDLATLLLKVQSIFPSKLDVSKKGEKKFFITFKRDTAAQIAIKILKDLEWNLLGFYSAKSICLKYGYAAQKESATAPYIPDSAPIAPVISNTSSNEGILKELKSMLADGNLSLETMERIQKALLDDFKRSNPEEYTKMLLAKLGY